MTTATLLRWEKTIDILIQNFNNFKKDKTQENLCLKGYPADNYNSGACGPDAANGGAFWPSQSAEDTCGVQFWSDQV